MQSNLVNYPVTLHHAKVNGFHSSEPRLIFHHTSDRPTQQFTLTQAPWLEKCIIFLFHPINSFNCFSVRLCGQDKPIGKVDYEHFMPSFRFLFVWHGSLFFRNYFLLYFSFSIETSDIEELYSLVSYHAVTQHRHLGSAFASILDGGWSTVTTTLSTFDCCHELHDLCIDRYIHDALCINKLFNVRNDLNECETLKLPYYICVCV